jgi:structural maintenance of chromosome 3 (chondroitin sulfate proteoglycan 6)
VVVDTDETASQVLEAMLKDKIGRVTFVPLNRLKTKTTIYPEAEGVEPLITQLKYDPKFDKAFQQVFGKTCVCENLNLAAKYARSHDLNTITVEGDRVDRKGALTGGYHDIRRSRMEGINAYKHWKAKHTEESERSAKLKSELVPLEQEITRISGEIQIAGSKQMRLLDSREPLSRDLAVLQKEKDQLEEKLMKEKSDIADLKTEISNLEARQKSLADEIGAPISNNLNARERKEMSDLAKQVEGLKGDVAESRARATEVCFL